MSTVVWSMGAGMHVALVGAQACGCTRVVCVVHKMCGWMKVRMFARGWLSSIRVHTVCACVRACTCGRGVRMRVRVCVCVCMYVDACAVCSVRVDVVCMCLCVFFRCVYGFVIFGGVCVC